MKTLKMILAGALLALLATSCRSTRNSALNPAVLQAGFSETNRVGVAIGGGNQVNTLLGGDGAFAAWKDVAKDAAANGTEFSLVVVGHGASKQPDVKRESSSAKKAQDAFVGAMAKASAGDKAGAAEGLGEAMLYATAYATEAANPPQADDTSLVAAHAAVGPGANLAGVAAAAELKQTRVEAIKAARSSYNVVTRYAPEDVTTKDGLETVQALAPYLADAYKAKLAADAAKYVPKAAEPTDKTDATDGDEPDADAIGGDLSGPTDRPAYDSLTKKNFLYKTRLAKTNPVTRHDSAVLIPKDRPQPVSISIPGQTVAENYFSTSEDRWIIRLKGALPATPAQAVVKYKDGGTETFQIDSLAGRTDRPAGPYKAPIQASDLLPDDGGTNAAAPNEGDAAAPGESPAQ